MTTPAPDIIDLLAGIQPGSHLDEVRSWRPEARENAQKSFGALFAPEIPGDVTLAERYAVATFVAGLHREPAVTAFYRSGLRKNVRDDLAEAVETEIARGQAEGPYGKFPKGPLSSEDKEGPVFRVSAEHRAGLGSRLVAALEHAHLLVFRPRDASPEALQKLLDAGWSTDDIVTVSQLVSFLAFQIRVIAGLRALGKNAERRVAYESSLAAALASGGNL